MIFILQTLREMELHTILSIIFFRRNRYYKGQRKLKNPIKIHKILWKCEAPVFELNALFFKTDLNLSENMLHIIIYNVAATLNIVAGADILLSKRIAISYWPITAVLRIKLEEYL